MERIEREIGVMEKDMKIMENLRKKEIEGDVKIIEEDIKIEGSMRIDNGENERKSGIEKERLKENRKSFEFLEIENKKIEGMKKFRIEEKEEEKMIIEIDVERIEKDIDNRDYNEMIL